jgi:hypothetical protein
LPRPSQVRSVSAMTLIPPAESSSSWRTCRRRSGDATSSAPARCGTRIRQSRGSSRAAGWMSARSRFLQEDEPPAGEPAS